MTNPQALREALEQIKANCFRSDITDHTALAGIAIIAKEALASTTVATAATPADARGIIDALEMCAFQLEQIAAPHMHGSVPGALAIQCGIKAKKAREIIAALPKAGRMPLPNMFDPAHDEAIDWVAENCMAIRRDNGDMDYSFGAMIAAYEAGKGPPRGDPEFGEAAGDYADAALDPFNSAALATPSGRAQGEVE